MEHLGIDLSKEYFDAMLRKSNGEKEHAQFKNKTSGFKKLAKWLKRQQVEQVHACMEATNIYWEDLAAFLHEAGHRVSVVNPMRIKGFSQMQMRRNKTDKQDSDVIVEYCVTMEPDAWTPPTPEQKRLRTLERHRDALIKMRTQQQNRLADCRDKDVRASLKRLIQQLQKEIKQVEAEIRTHIKEVQSLREQKALLLSIPGIGPGLAHKLLAEMYDLANYSSAHAAAADAGVTPAHHTSGDTIRRNARMSKVGKASVRGTLYFPAISAMNCNPVIQALVQRLEQKHKPWKVILGAAMRKLVHLAYGVLKNQSPFDPNWHASSPAPT